MEDAMIINKSAYERGFGHGSVYKTKTKILNEKIGNHSSNKCIYRLLNCKLFQNDITLFKNALRGQPIPNYIDKEDGLPLIDTYLTQGMIEMVYIDIFKNSAVIKYYKDNEPAHVDQIKVFSSDKDQYEFSISIKYRYDRNPIIGDKFS